MNRRGARPLHENLRLQLSSCSACKGFYGWDGKVAAKGHSRTALETVPPQRENTTLQKSAAALYLTPEQQHSDTGEAFVLDAVPESQKVPEPGS